MSEGWLFIRAADAFQRGIGHSPCTVFIGMFQESSKDLVGTS